MWHLPKDTKQTKTFITTLQFNKFFRTAKTKQILAQNSKILDTYLKTRSKRRSGEMQTELESSWFLNLTWSSINEFLSLLSRDISVEHCIKKLVKTQRAVVHHVSVANCGLTGLALLSFEASCAAHCGPKTWILFKNSNNPKDIPLSETRFEYVLDIANF